MVRHKFHEYPSLRRRTCLLIRGGMARLLWRRRGPMKLWLTSKKTVVLEYFHLGLGAQWTSLACEYEVSPNSERAKVLLVDPCLLKPLELTSMFLQSCRRDLSMGCWVKDIEQSRTTMKNCPVYRSSSNWLEVMHSFRLWISFCFVLYCSTDPLS